MCSAGGHRALGAESLLRGLDWVDGLHTSPVAGGQSEGGRLAGVVLTQEEGQVEAGVQECGVSRRGAAWPRPPSLHRRTELPPLIWPLGAAGPSPRRAGIFHPFSLALIFFF